MPAFPASRSRRRALGWLASVPLLPAWPAQTLPPAFSCRVHESPTAAQTEGPFYRRSTPLRSSLIEPGMQGERLLLAGQVLDTDCRPLPGTVLDFWQADAAGRYDNEGYRLRGHMIADAQGRYHLETIIPGGYTGRTRHIHVKLQAPQVRMLTTQLYFPEEPLNRRDSLYSGALQMALTRGDVAAQGRFDFVLQRS
jgi:protocatechuate 3,4-dioxygenase beta subunit